ncbi:hypothetical protein ABK040_004410 [Willaertia magna]
MIQDKVENNQVESNEKNNVPNEANGLNDNDNNTEFRKEKKPKDPRKKCIVKEGEGQVATKGSNIRSMPNLFKESLYDTVVTEGAIENSMNNLNEEEENYLEDYDEDKWEELQKRDEMLGKKPWFTSDGGVIYLDKN